MANNLFVSFSGGETSALMTHLLLSKWRKRFDQIVVVFANTGQENEATLEFVRDCDKAFGFNTVWVEAEVNPEPRKGTTHRVVTFDTASRDGRPFEDTIKKFGIPNQKFPNCTRELKLRPLLSYIRALGWKPTEFQTAIGIRADEAGRRSKQAAANGLIYPLLDWAPTTKPQVNTFWNAQPFRLNLAGYQGNCKTCWKKSFRKLLTVMDEAPEAFTFFDRMEQQYGLVGPEFKKKHSEGYRRTFFRGNLSVADLRTMRATGEWDRAENDAIVYSGTPIPLDVDADDGCTESCEVNFG